MSGLASLIAGDTSCMALLVRVKVGYLFIYLDKDYKLYLPCLDYMRIRWVIIPIKDLFAYVLL
jgi:hypothetical protein